MKIIDWSTALSMPAAPPHYVIPAMGIEAGPPTLLAAYGGTGKTYLATEIAVGVASGTPILGQIATVQGRVVWLDAELGFGKYTDNYLRRVCFGRGIKPVEGQLGITSTMGEPGQLMLDDEKGIAALGELIDGAKLCICDSLRRLHAGDENDTRAALVLQQLARLSLRTGCAIVLIHHASKPSKEARSRDARYSLRGTSAYFDGAACVFDLQKTKTGFCLTQTKTRAAELLPPLHYRIENCGEYRGPGLGYEGVRLMALDVSGDLSADVLACVSAHPGIGREEITKQLPRRAADVRAAVDDLTANGKLAETLRGKKRTYSVAALDA